MNTHLSSFQFSLRFHVFYRQRFADFVNHRCTVAGTRLNLNRITRQLKMFPIFENSDCGPTSRPITAQYRPATCCQRTDCCHLHCLFWLFPNVNRAVAGTGLHSARIHSLLVRCKCETRFAVRHTICQHFHLREKKTNKSQFSRASRV